LNTSFEKAIDTPINVEAICKLPDLTPPDFYLRGAAQSAVYRDRPRSLNELKTATTAFIRNISQADPQNVFANKIKRVQACIDARGHHLQHIL
jgi:hypothetical protein